MINSAKEAREMVELHKHQAEAIKEHLRFDPFLEAGYLYTEAKGYLAALEGPEVKALVEALESFTDGDGDVITTDKAEKALSQWKKAVKK